ncbi:MAG: DUF2974 domain-containing protein [Clostridia bacterium]|nr:DUF2974 domain-containing protein [Clostridia bacterium]
MNLFEYLDYRGDTPFSQVAFGEVDNLILSEICYLDNEHLVSSYPTDQVDALGEVVNRFFFLHKKETINLGLIVPSQIVDLTEKVGGLTRYRNIGVSNYVCSIDHGANFKQFSAITFLIGEDLMYIALRGTDDTLAGWHENLHLMCTMHVPAALEAVAYVNKVASLFPTRRIIIGGHSKGGYLSTYAGVYCEDTVQDRIVKVYSNDGPGYAKSVIDRTRLERILPRMVSIVPTGSVVGLLFDYEGERVVISSTYKGLYQHDGLSWEVDGDNFVRRDSIDAGAITASSQSAEFISSLTTEQKLGFLTDIEQFIRSTNKYTLLDVSKDFIKVLLSSSKLKFKNVRLLLRFVGILFKNKVL